MARPSKAPAAHDDSSDDEGEAEEDEDEGGDERQPSDDELAQKPKETEDIPDDGGGKQQPAVMQPGIGHVPPSAEQQLSPEGNVASRASPQGGHAEDDKTKKNADSTIPVSTVDDDDGDDGDDEDVDDDQPVQEDVDLSGGAQNRWGKNEPRVGVQQRYEWRVQRRIRYEVGKKFPALERKTATMELASTQHQEVHVCSSLGMSQYHDQCVKGLTGLLRIRAEIIAQLQGRESANSFMMMDQQRHNSK
ncbi:hypothetical protein THAOC_23726 [Thalassiosira oceanica]|uniref:Uncharacterized protein n=1 Tax=Thalassiosira oceanica TaxID=159749 RepID=K0RTM5_THAOC|nr:hypothetical protein THAOC_23726 [Thalassiosira oceanica]|eukprot:EJK56390.1 hypothetical protein THAOC_23726 [Thalassiosira oceanica]